MSSGALERLTSAVRAEGLIAPRTDGVVLLSGGADSAVLAAVAVAICGPEAVYGIHLNYGLREDADRGEEAARALCAKLRIDLHIERPDLGRGNVQARAREARYRAGERLRRKLGAEWLAAGHTRTDLAETVLYRLAVSPGSRALLGLPARNGRLVRPLLRVGRAVTRALARDAGLPFADDPTNATPRYARNRIRNEILPLLAEIGPEAERNIAETQAEMREEARVLRDVAERAIEESGAGGGEPLGADALVELGPPLQRLVLRTLAERAAERTVPLSRARAAEIVRLAAEPEGGTIELGRGLRAICEAGGVRFAAAAHGVPPAAPMTIPGTARFGEWELRAEVFEGEIARDGPGVATLDAGALGTEVEVRAWRDGDRIRPLGLGGSKSLQDLFTDAGVPRSLRRQLPVLVSRGRIAWVAGLAIGEEFRLPEGAARAAVITADRVDS
jgi:tRNA(Ile)-lysidine synthase